MTSHDDGSRKGVPARALFLSLAALAVPSGAALLVPDILGEQSVFLWLLALIPAFLLAYHRGWQGAAAALAAGMVTLSITQVVAQLIGHSIPEGLFPVVVAYIVITLGVGWMAEVLLRDKDRMEGMAFEDGLTRLPHRRHARVFLENEFAAAQRGRLLCVVLFDLDDFKGYNDRLRPRRRR
jgi:predicted signal transduction protein with EAL and GGDEF domain